MLFQWPFAKVTHFQVSMSNCYSYDSWNSIRLIHSSHWRLQVVYVQNSMLFLCPYRDRQTHCANNDNKPSRLGISYYVYTFKRFFPSISGSDYNVSIAHHIGNTMLFCFVLSSSHQSICLCISGGLILIYFVLCNTNLCHCGSAIIEPCPPQVANSFTVNYPHELWKRNNLYSNRSASECSDDTKRHKLST